MGELSLVRRGASGPKVQVLTVRASSQFSISFSGVTIAPSRMYLLSNSQGVSQAGDIICAFWLGWWQTVSLEGSSLYFRDSKIQHTLSGGTLTLTEINTIYFHNGADYTIILIED
ncbi:MAG: hypothetical protein VB058_05775 [Oscillospiraceae bacterium]|nr:hypothetical protein [Oscillospiraceae bacterium]